MPTRLLYLTLAALLLAGAGGTIYFNRQAEKNAQHAASVERELIAARTEATQQRERADKLIAKATELDTQLGHAKTRSTATETKNSQLSRELTAAKSSLSEREQREVALIAEIESLRQRIQSATASAAPAPVATGPLPPSSATVAPEPPTAATSQASLDIEESRARIASLEAQLTDLLTRALAEPITPTPTAPTATAPTFQVVRVGPRDAFVVVDYGASDGATIGDELALTRGTTVVARVQISDARSKFSVAQVLPATLKRQLQPGDFVLIAK
jgi:hypothetical protein